VRQKVDVARGFDALDAACAAAGRRSALESFGLRWGIFRGKAQPPKVDPFAAAIVAQDLTQLKELIGGSAAEKIRVDVESLPLDLLRGPQKKARLLELAAAVGGEVLRYLLEFHQLKPDRCALEQAIAFGDPETIRMIWDRMEAETRVKERWALMSSIIYHHAEIAKWLCAEHPPWLGLARRMAREKRAFDVLLRLPEGDEELPELKGLVKDHAKALDQLGVPLTAAVRWVYETDPPEGFDDCLYRVGQSLLLLEDRGGSVFGALITIPWPKLGTTAKDVWCGSFLFTLDGGETKRFPAATPPVLFYNEDKICAGELTLDLKKEEYSVDATSSCTGGLFPAASGKVTTWGIWGL
jgi:hypothetical protein